MQKNALSSFEYCPRCGDHSFTPEGERAMVCSHCGLRYYANVASAVALFVVDKSHRLLSVVREREPAKGTLDLPGGFVDPMETVEDAVYRELKEETGLQPLDIHYITSLPNIYPYSGINVFTSDLFFVCYVEDLSKAVAQDDAAGIVITSLDDIKGNQYGLESIRKMMSMIEQDKNLLKKYLSDVYYK